VIGDGCGGNIGSGRRSGSEVSTGQYPADHVASYASQHKKGLPIDRSSRKAGPPLLSCFLTPLLRGRGIPLISSYSAAAGGVDIPIL
jgi:hypothetical protein